MVLVNEYNSFTGTVTATDNGIYEIRYTVSVAGSYTLEIRVQPGGSGPTYEIKDSGLPVVVAVNEVDASLTTLTGDGVTDSMAGVIASFTVTLFDSGNNQREVGGDLLLVEISNGVTEIETFDNNDGTYRVDYLINDATTTHELSVTINGDTGNTKTSTITTVANDPHADSSTMSTTELTELDASYPVDVQVFDAYGNPITLSEQPIVLVATGHDANLYFTYAAGSSASLYELTYALPSGTEDVSRCGFYTLSSFLLIQGGLEGHYYTNRWLSGTPYLTQYDALININWGQGDLIENVAANHVSIEWEGFLLPAYSEVYTFEVNCNDGVQLWIDDQLIID